MKNTEGWIKWWRKAEFNEVLTDDKMDRTHAFMYLVMSANIKQGKTTYGEVIKRGQFKTSIRKLSTAFGWSVKKTMRFLDDLERAGMVHTERHTKGTLVTIEKYSTFQDARNTKGNTDRNAKCTLSKKIGEEEKNAQNVASKEAPIVPEEYDLSVPPVEEW